jgi:hypothetical protein
MHTGIICACLPSLRIIIKHHYPSTLELRPQFSIVPPFPTDDLQLSAQTQQTQLFENSFGTTKSSGKVGSIVLLQSVDSNDVDEERDKWIGGARGRYRCRRKRSWVVRGWMISREALGLFA